MSIPLTKQQVDQAAPLDFPARPARQELTITIRARVDGYDTEICYTGGIDQLLTVTKRLRELGAEPVSGAPAPPAQAERKSSKRVRVEYNDDGDACCPVHHKPLAEGRFGLYCPSRAKGDEAANDKGYCALRFTE